MNDSLRIPRVEYTEVFFSTITVSVYLSDGRRAVSALKLDDEELYEVGKRPRLPDYELKYQDDARYMYSMDLNRWYKRADILAEEIGSKVARTFIKALEGEPKQGT